MSDYGPCRGCLESVKEIGELQSELAIARERITYLEGCMGALLEKPWCKSTDASLIIMALRAGAEPKSRG